MMAVSDIEPVTELVGAGEMLVGFTLKGFFGSAGFEKLLSTGMLARKQ